MKIDLNKVYPKLKVVSNATRNDSGKEQSSLQVSFEDSPLYIPFIKELGIFYAVDAGTHFELLQNRHIEHTEGIKTIHKAALNNLDRDIVTITQARGNPDDMIMLTNGGDFEATMMVLPTFINDLERYMNSKICVSIPTRDVLIAVPINNVVGLEKMRTAIRGFFDKQADGLLVRHIFVWKNNIWEVMETV